MKQKIRGSAISFKCDGDSESLEQVLRIHLIAAQNYQINTCKNVTKNLAQIYFADRNAHLHAFRQLLRTNVRQ
jgi:hypothetical protein